MESSLPIYIYLVTLIYLTELSPAVTGVDAWVNLGN